MVYPYWFKQYLFIIRYIYGYIQIIQLTIGDNAVTSSIRIIQVFPELVGKKTRAIWEVKGDC